MTITTSDYHVLADNVKTEFLSFVGADFDGVDNSGVLRTKKFTFNPSNDIVLNNIGKDRPIISFHADPKGARNVQLKVLIRKSNGVEEEIGDPSTA